MGLAASHLEWVAGFLDECWWSRVAQTTLHSFSEAGEPLRLVEQPLEKDDPDPRRPSLATGFICQSWRRRGCVSWTGDP